MSTHRGLTRPVSLGKPSALTEALLNSWDLKSLDLKPRLPEILASSSAARAIALDIAAGESLSEHEVHERAWLVVIDGAIEVTTVAGERASGGAGL
jgi:hypothetical protein